MNYKTILLHVDVSQRAHERIKLAANMAISNDAHLIGTAATGLSGLVHLPGSIGESNVYLHAFVEVLQTRAQHALGDFESMMQKMGVVSFEKRIIDEEAGIGISLQARYSDLVIIGQTDPNESSPALRTDFPEYVVMHSSRPVLIVPYAGQFEHIGKRVLIAWDASMAATRAVTAAMPLLKQADTVQIVIFNPEARPEAHGEQPGADIALYLARHDINVEVLPQTAAARTASQWGKTADLDIGHALLSHAADFNADLLIMGGYTHTRFREILLGGVTHTMLKSMTIPVLMMH